MQPTHSKGLTPEEATLTVVSDLQKKSLKIVLQSSKHDVPAIYTMNDEPATARMTHAVGVIEELKKKWSLGKQDEPPRK